MKKPDAIESLCAFMQPKPSGPMTPELRRILRWWRMDLRSPDTKWIPRRFTLNECREIEVVLNRWQRADYIEAIEEQGIVATTFEYVNLSLEQKINALAVAIQGKAPGAAPAK